MTRIKYQINHKLQNSSFKPFEILTLIIGAYLGFVYCDLEFIK